MSLYLAPNEDVIPTPGQAEITEVRAFVSCSNDYGYDMAMADSPGFGLELNQDALHLARPSTD